MSLYNTSYFKKWYTMQWGGDYQLQQAIFRLKTAWINKLPTVFGSPSDYGKNGNFGWHYPWHNTWEWGDPTNPSQYTKGYQLKYGLPKWKAEFYDKLFGEEFVQKAAVAKIAYLNGDSEEMFILSSMMIQFMAQFGKWVKKEHFQSWRGIEFTETTDYKEYGYGPWTKTIWKIFTSFEEVGTDGKTMWETIFEVSTKTAAELKIPWGMDLSNTQGAWNDSNRFNKWIDKFFLAWDKDGGGLDTSKLSKWPTTTTSRGTLVGASAQILAFGPGLFNGCGPEFTVANNTLMDPRERKSAPWLSGNGRDDRKGWAYLLGSMATSLMWLGMNGSYIQNNFAGNSAITARWMAQTLYGTGIWGGPGDDLSVVLLFPQYVGTFKATKDKIIELFNETAVYGPDITPPEHLTRNSTWTQAIGRKTKRIVRRGMWLAPWLESMTKLNFGGGSTSKEYEHWLKYDPTIHWRVGHCMLEWDDDNADYSDDNGWQMEYAFFGHHRGATPMVKFRNVGGGTNGNPGTENYLNDDYVDHRAMKVAFRDGLYKTRHGGSYPFLFYNPKGSEKTWVGMTSEDSECQRPKNSTLVGLYNSSSSIADKQAAEDFWKKGKDPSGSDLVAQRIEPAGVGDLAVFMRVKNGDTLDTKLKTYGDYAEYVNAHYKKVNEVWKAKDGYYGSYAKHYAYGMDKKEHNVNHGHVLVGKDENGNDMPKWNLLGNGYQAFLTELRHNSKLSASLQREADDIFEEITSYLAYSQAAHFLCCVRDEIYFTLYNGFVEDSKSENKFNVQEVMGVEDQITSLQKEQAKEANQASADAQKDELSDEDVEQRQAFYKQCFLLMNMQKLKDAYAIDARECYDAKNGKVSAIHKQGNEFGGRIRLINTDDTEGDKTSVINRLTSPNGESISGFFDARPELISALVPQIRLFRVQSESGSSGGQGLTRIREIEFDFPKHNNPDESQYRGDLAGVRDKWEFGIKEFSFSFDGTSPATARNDIKASLTLFFRDFNDLIKPRALNEFTKYSFSENSDPIESALKSNKNKYSYLDLILFPGSRHQGHKEQPLQYNASQYRIRADVGWAFPQGLVSEGFKRLCEQSNTTPADLKIALDKINKSFYLNMVDHDLDFANDGSVTIKIEYRAYMESAAKSTSLDVLSTPEINSMRRILQSELEGMWAHCSPEDMNELINTYKTLETEMLKKSYQSIITRLLRRQRMMYVFSDAESRKQFATHGFFEKPPKLYNGPDAKEAGPQAETQQAKMKNSTTNERPVADTFVVLDGKLSTFPVNSIDPDDSNLGLEVVNFFYVGDLFYTLMDCMYHAPDKTKPGQIVGKPREDVKNTKLLLSSFKYKDPLDVKQEREINISQIPVSVDFFLEFINKNVLEGERRTYPLMYFIRDFCNRLIVDLMNELCIKSINPNQRVRFQTANLLAMPEKRGDPDPVKGCPFVSDTSPIRNVTMGHKKGVLPFISSINGGEQNRSIEDAINYITVYPVASNMVTTDPEKAPKGIKSDDEANGIRHLYIGRPKGLVKTVKFSKVDMQYIREARYFNHGYNGLMQLGSVYKASVDMIGNTLFYPGMTIFINPISLASEGMDPTDGGGDGGAPSIANALGIGGYHLITKVKSVLAPGKFNTTVDARFYYSGDGNSLKLQNPKQNEDSGKTDLESEIESLEDATSRDVSNRVCTNIIKLRQKQTGNLFSPNFAVDLSGVGEDDIESKVDQIAAEEQAQQNALKEQRTKEQQEAAQREYEERKKAIEDAGN